MIVSHETYVPWGFRQPRHWTEPKRPSRQTVVSDAHIQTTIKPIEASFMLSDEIGMAWQGLSTSN